MARSADYLKCFSFSSNIRKVIYVIVMVWEILFLD